MSMSRLTYLDCENIVTIYNSLYTILGIDRNKIEFHLQQLDIENDNRYDTKYGGDLERWILGTLEEEVSIKINLSGVYWFHLTRVPSSTTFEKGILPLGQSLERIWSFLYSLVHNQKSPSEWQRFRQKVETERLSHDAGLYQLKAKHPDQWGPFAILVRDIAFVASEVGNHDYLYVPETVEDICRCFQQEYHFDLLQLFQANTKPCIVKFWTPQVKHSYIGTALYYLYSVLHKQELSIYCNACFDGRGESIKPNQIEKVDFLDYKPQRNA